MPLNIEASSVISSFWTSFKSSVSNKSLLMQYDDDGTVYSIFAFDGPSIVYVTIIWKGTVPDNVINAGYVQATNDADKSDFETNFKPSANKPIGLQISRDGYAIASNPVLIAGTDGANARSISVDSAGKLLIGPVSVSQADVTSTGNLNALNASVSVALAGTAGIGMQLATGTLVGTIVPEISNDGGTTWLAGQFFDPITGVLASSVVFGIANTATTKTVIIAGGVSHVRVRVSAFTSGTASCALRATTANDPSTAIRGTDGTILRTILLDSLGRIVTAPAGSAATSGISFGTVATAATTNVPVRATTYTEQAADATRSITSSSASDAAAGVGARQVTITYYTSAGVGPLTTIVTLNGTTAVATSVSNICFIEKMEVTSVGSTGSNVGTITLFVNNAGGGGTIGTIVIGDNRTLWAHHYVGSTVSCYITGLTGNNNNSSNGTILTIRTRPIGGTAPEIQSGDFFRVGGATAQSTRSYGTPIKITGPARVIVYGAPEGSPNIVTRVGMDFYDQ